MIKLLVEQIQQQITAFNISSTNGCFITSSWLYQGTLFKENKYSGLPFEQAPTIMH